MTAYDRVRDGFVLTAHRGAVDQAPENTILAFRRAEELGFEEIELDVQLSADEVLVICHDRTFDRLRLAGDESLDRPVETLSYADLRDIDLGCGQRVPTFDDVLDAVSVSLQVEIKAPRAAIGLARALARRSAQDRARCVVTSFYPHALAAFQREAPEMPRGTGLLVWSLDTDWRHDAQSLGVRNLFLHWPGLTRELVCEYQERGVRVCASMLNHAGELRRAIETQVDGSSTDRPAIIYDLLGLRKERTTGHVG